MVHAIWFVINTLYIGVFYSVSLEEFVHFSLSILFIFRSHPLCLGVVDYLPLNIPTHQSDTNSGKYPQFSPNRLQDSWWHLKFWQVKRSVNSPSIGKFVLDGKRFYPWTSSVDSIPLQISFTIPVILVFKKFCTNIFLWILFQFKPPIHNSEHFITLQEWV